MRLPESLQAARVRLVADRPFLAAAVWSLVPVEAPGLGTVAVDEWGRLYYDPETVAQWSLDERVGVLYHEICHLLRDHAGRLGSYPDSRRANVAADLEINDDLTDGEHVRLPAGALHPQQYELMTGQTAEHYYDALPRDMEAAPHPHVAGGDCGSVADGHERSWEAGPPGTTNAEGETTPDGLGPVERDLVRRRVAEEVQSAKGLGSIPGHWERWAERVLTPVVDWRRHLRSAVRAALATAAGREDYTWVRPSRRQSAVPSVVLPSLVARRPRVAVVVDTSGSMGRDQLARAVAEVDGVLRTVGTPIDVLAVDTAVAARSRVSRRAHIRLGGGGGTNMGAGLRAVAEIRPAPDVAIVLTDGETPWPEAPPPRTRVVVGLVGARESVRTPAWAKQVRIPVEEET